VVFAFLVGCVGSLSWVCSFMLCVRLMMDISSGYWCWFGVIGFLGIGVLHVRNASVRMIELLIMVMADFSVMGLFVFGMCWVNGSRRKGLFTREHSIVLVSCISCWKWWHWMHHGVGVVIFVDVVLVKILSDIVGVSSFLVRFVVVFCLLWVCM